MTRGLPRPLAMKLSIDLVGVWASHDKDEARQADSPLKQKTINYRDTEKNKILI
jgi:hypothetical protein